VDRYTLTSESLQSRSVRLNGRPLQLDAGDDLPIIAGEATRIGDLDFAPASVSFLALPSARNPACG
jgi:heparanase